MFFPLAKCKSKPFWGRLELITVLRWLGKSSGTWCSPYTGPSSHASILSTGAIELTTVQLQMTKDWYFTESSEPTFSCSLTGGPAASAGSASFSSHRCSDLIQVHSWSPVVHLGSTTVKFFKSPPSLSQTREKKANQLWDKVKIQPVLPSHIKQKCRCGGLNMASCQVPTRPLYHSSAGWGRKNKMNKKNKKELVPQD